MKINKIVSLAVLFTVSLLISAPGAEALEVRSGDSVTVDSPIDDDVFASGNRVDIRAPVNGAVIAAGNVAIDAPVRGDVVVVGGDVVINSDVEGKIVAAGGNIELKGSADNVVAAGGNINIRSSAVVLRDALVVGGSVNNEGRINGNLKVTTSNFQNSGSVGSVDYGRAQSPQDVWRGFAKIIGLFSLLWLIGSLILGIVLVMLFPSMFLRTKDEIVSSTLKKTIVGFVLILASIALMIILFITIVGIPIALMACMVFIIALVLANFFVAFALGRKIGGIFRANLGNVVSFVIGFIVLNIILVIPFIGGLAQIVVSSLGFASIYYALRGNWRGREVEKQRV